MNIQFGTGSLFGFNTGVGASGDVSHTPVQFGGLQDVQLEFDGTTKDLYGQYQFPLAVARGKMKVTGKAKFAAMDAKVYNELYWAQTLTVGQEILSLNEAQTVPGSSTFTTTPTNTANFLTDYGIKLVSTGMPLNKVAAGLASAGSYSIIASTGVATYGSAQAGAAVQLSYGYSIASAGSAGQSLILSNQLQGFTPVFQCALQESFQNQTFAVQLYACVAAKLTVPTKMEDFTISDFEFAAFVNAAGNLGKISFPQ